MSSVPVEKPFDTLKNDEHAIKNDGDAPPPPPPLPLAAKKVFTHTILDSPSVTPSRPAGAFLVELLIFNGSPFKDHWAYWVSTHVNSTFGVQLHATGEVMNGFRIEMKRSYDFTADGDYPTKRIPLQWVDAEYFDEEAMFNDNVGKSDNAPVCVFESSACKIKAPEKTLHAVRNPVGTGKKIIQRDCQTWIVESADQLVKDHIFNDEVANYLHAIEQ